MQKRVYNNWYCVSSSQYAAGIHFGHKSISSTKSGFWHPLMCEYLVGRRYQISISSIQQTLKSLLRAFHVLASICHKGGNICIINTNPEFVGLCTNWKFLGHQCSTKKGAPVISVVGYKWIGGTLTNWRQISRSIYTFALFSERCQQFLYQNDIDFPLYQQRQKCYGGWVGHNKNSIACIQKPDCVFLINPNENTHILREAYQLGIPVLAFTESNTSPKWISYPIPVNNYSIQWIYYCLCKIIKLSTLYKS